MAVTDRLPADRNPHQAAEWDSLRQLRYKLTTSILPFLCFCFFSSSLSLLSLPLCVVAFEDSQLQYQKRALLSYSLFSNCNLLLLLSHTQFFRIQKIEEKSISCAGHADAHAYIQTDGYTDTRSKQTKSNNIKRHQSENQCPSWIV